MRPIRLELSAFGSFPGTETVDFAELARDGLFLVTGATGTGKTTLFDAMCWALYGVTPRKQDVRSDHVDDDVRCEVRFTFEVDDRRWEVVRNPEQQRPAKRGGRLVHEPAGVSLHDLSGVEPPVAGARAVETRCTELIGLTAEQFQRVVLLPQGDFTAFLRAKSAEREALLAELFGVGRYDDLVTHLKAEHDRLKTDLAFADRDVVTKLAEAHAAFRRAAAALADSTADDDTATDTATDTLERTDVVAVAESIEPLLATARDEAALRADEAERASKEREAVEAAHERFRAFTGYREQLTRLAERDDEIARLAASADDARDARPVVEADDAHRAAATKRDEAERSWQERTGAITAAFAELDVAVTDETTARLVGLSGALRTRTTEDLRAFEALDGAEGAHGEATTAVEEALARVETAEGSLTSLDERLAALATRREELLADPVDPATIAAEVEDLRRKRSLAGQLADALAVRTSAEESSRSASEAYATTFDGWIAGQAPRLAASLVPGNPCPVCGSTEHPAPATSDGAATCTDDDLAEAERRRDDARRTLDGILASIRTLVEELGDGRDRPVPEWDALVSAAEERLRVARETAVELDGIDADLRTVGEERSGCAATLAAAREEHARCVAAAEKTAAARAAALEAAAGLDRDELVHRSAVLERLDGLLEGHDTVERARDTAATLERSTHETLETALAESRWGSVAEARAAFLDVETERSRRESVTRHEEAKTELQTRMNELEQQGVPDEAPDLEAARTAESAAKKAADAARERVTKAETNMETGRDALDEHDRLVSSTAELRATFEPVERAFRACKDGGPAVKMSLERWVLTRELDRITAVANEHLASMSDERYTLHRRPDPSGNRDALDLEVFDAHTGKSRPTNSLSGGEQFQASLALALGLADVVARGGTASGHRFESLFVDEGFGSLDREALDDAIAALVALQGTGRMVGAITHVESMKEDLRTGIEVLRKPDGRGSTIRTFDS